MKKTDFLLLLDHLLGSPRGTLQGPEILDDLPAWDSLAVVGFVALMDDKLGVTLPASSLRNCKTIDDLCGLAANQLTA